MYKKSAEHGHAVAQKNLEMMYRQQGKVLPKEVSEKGVAMVCNYDLDLVEYDHNLVGCYHNLVGFANETREEAFGIR